MVNIEILDISQDSTNGSIVVKTQYKLDGVEVLSNYPTFNGKYYWVTRYNIDSFAGMTDVQAKLRIFKDLKQFAENLIRKAYFKVANYTYNQAKASLLIGQTGTVETASIQVDTNADGVADTLWTVKSDGTRTESSI